MNRPENNAKEGISQLVISFPQMSSSPSMGGKRVMKRPQAELKNGTKFRNTEYYKLEGNKIKEVEVYFGSA
jgi:hypothetical protein